MNPNTSNTEITPTELKAMLDAGKSPLLLDVREPHELAICALPGITHIPMGDLPHHLDELKLHQDRDIVVICRSGARSDRCAMFLRQHGFASVINLLGGMLGWSDEVDSSVQKY